MRKEMEQKKSCQTVEVLLVEDNPGDIRLTEEAFKDGKICNHLNVVRDGVEAMTFLHRKGPYANAPRPDLILLDLNLPKKDGRDVLAEIKVEEDLKQIPVVVLTTSNAEKDIVKTSHHHASCYIIKPVDFAQFIAVVKLIEDFGLSIINLSKSGDADV